MNESEKTVTVVKRGDGREKIVASLASAFEHDPFFLYCFGEIETAIDSSKPPKKKKNYVEQLRVFFDSRMRVAFKKKNSVIHASSDGKCAALWVLYDGQGQGKNDLREVEILTADFRCFQLRTFHFYEYAAIIEQYHPKKPHMYLRILGTSQDAQGNGIGSKVIKKMLEQCDKDEIGVYLVSSNVLNIPFYQKHGFEITDTIKGLPEDFPQITAMWRDPKNISESKEAV